MITQPEALRLADELDTHAHHAMNGEAFCAAVKAVAELRRLQAEVERLNRVNAELVEVLRKAENQIIALSPNGYIAPALGAIHATLAKATGETK